MADSFRRTPAKVGENRVIGPTTRTSVAFELGPPLNMATDGLGD